MPKRQGRDDFGLNLKTRKTDAVEVQTDFDVLILIEVTANILSVGGFVIRCDKKLPLYSRLELRSRLCELELRHNPVVIFVEFCNLRCVLNCQRQCRLQAFRELPYR
jgi:hypothetical protein